MSQNETSEPNHLPPMLILAIPPLRVSMPQDRPERTHNSRGFLIIGPQCVSPSDVLANMIDGARLSLSEPHYAPNPNEQRRAMRIYSARHAQRMRELV